MALIASMPVDQSCEMGVDMRILLRVGLGLLCLLAAGVGFVWWYDHVGQRPDPDFDARVASPAYPAGAGGRHPRVVIDGAHRNFHTATDRYKPFVELLTSDGYAVSESRRELFAQTLDGGDGLGMANAMGPGDQTG